MRKTLFNGRPTGFFTKWAHFNSRVCRGFWLENINRREFLDELGEKLEISVPYEYCKLQPEIIKQNGGKSLFYYFPTYYELLTNIYPDFEFSPFLFNKIPETLVKNRNTHRKLLDEFRKRIFINEPKQWFLISKKQYQLLGIQNLISSYQSLQDMLKKNYPEVDWTLTYKLNEAKPAGFWDSKENQKHFLEQLAKLLDVKNNDWSNVTVDTIRKYGGRQLLKKYPTFYDALNELFPAQSEEDHHTRLKLLRARVPNNYWQNKENQVRFMDNLRKNLNLKNVQELKNIPISLIHINGGHRLLRHYSSYHQLLSTIYPNEQWDPLDFAHISRNYWNNSENIVKFLNSMKKKYKITKKEDWYRISLLQIRGENGAGLIRTFGSLYSILRIAYPDEKWDSNLFIKRDKKSKQRWLFLQTQELFPDEEIIEEFSFQYNTRALQLDVFVGKYNLGIEYQGEHHYQDIPTFGGVEMYITRDKEKLEICKECKINLVVVPYWWDTEKESLKQLIIDVCPDIKFPQDLATQNN